MQGRAWPGRVWQSRVGHGRVGYGRAWQGRAWQGRAWHGMTEICMLQKEQAISNVAYVFWMEGRDSFVLWIDMIVHTCPCKVGGASLI